MITKAELPVQDLAHVRTDVAGWHAPDSLLSRYWMESLWHIEVLARSGQVARLYTTWEIQFCAKAEILLAFSQEAALKKQCRQC